MATNDHSPEGAQGALPTGTVLSGTYEIIRQIGLGGMAEVYRARNVHTDETVAVKVVLPEFARDQTNLALFRKEATVLSRLHHDAIVRYQTFMVEPTMNRPYLVMEFVDGVPLSEHIKRAPLSAADTRTLIARIASGLAVAHAAEVIHRDLSPDNIILPEDDVARAKIVDFGIAKATRIGEGTLLGGKFAGKYNFVSPEQLGLAGGEITGQSDIYSLGLIAAAALLGHSLDMSGSQFEVLEKRRAVPDLTGIDPSMIGIVTAMLQPLPEHRPRTMADVTALLASGGPAVSAAPASPPQGGRLNDTGTVISDGPFRAPPPRPAADPWADGGPEHRSLPPQPMPGSWPAERSQPPQPPGSWPRDPAPQQGSWQQETSRPPQPMPGSWQQSPAADPVTTPPFPPGGGTGAPGFAPPGDAGPPAGGAPPRSESPFGPYDGPSTTFGKSRNPKPKPKSRAGLFVGIAAAVVLIGGGAVFFLQGGFGLLATSGPPVVTTTTATPTPTTTTAVTPTVTPTVAPPSTTTTTSVADLPPAKPPQEQLTGAAARLAWLKDYALTTCQYAAPLTVADTAMAIEAIGTNVAPFEKLAADFTRDNGFEPDLGVRLIADPQCAAADFLRDVQPLSKAGPTMTLSTDNLPSGGTLEGQVTGTEGWTTDLLLVDYAGGVQNLSIFLTTSGNGASFVLPPLLSKSSEPVPMMVIAISSKGGLNSTRLVRTHEAKQIFPIILREIQSREQDVSVAVQYFRLGGATAP